MSKVEKAAGIIKLGVAIGSAYMLYRQYQKTQAAEAQAQATAAQLVKSGAEASATMPLVAAIPQAVASNQPAVVPATSVNTDQQDVVQKLLASGAQRVFGMGAISFGSPVVSPPKLYKNYKITMTNVGSRMTGDRPLFTVARPDGSVVGTTMDSNQALAMVDKDILTRAPKIPAPAPTPVKRVSAFVQVPPAPAPVKNILTPVGPPAPPARSILDVLRNAPRAFTQVTPFSQPPSAPPLALLAPISTRIDYKGYTIFVHELDTSTGREQYYEIRNVGGSPVGLVSSLQEARRLIDLYPTVTPVKPAPPARSILDVLRDAPNRAYATVATNK